VANSRCWRAVLLVVMALGALGVHGALAQTVASRYFPQTGHSVQNEFLRFFDAQGGLEIFGYPLTEAFVENGRLVQYFQKVRMEAYPENPAPYQVRLGMLGEQLGYRHAPIPTNDIPPANDPNRRYYAETGHTVSYSFLAYYDRRGGAEIFGYPVTEFILENGRIVQYFQRARMEWHPQLPPERRVQLGNLGEIYATTRLDPSLLQPPSGQLAPNAPQITALRPRASLRHTITGTTGRQVLYVYVADQRSKPVQGAGVVALIRFPSGERSLTLPATDANGHSQLAFDLGQLAPGQLVVVQVNTAWGTVVAQTQTSFLAGW